MLRGEVGRERIRLLVDEEVDAVLAVDGDRARAMLQDRAETHALEQRMQFGGLAGRRRELDELEPVDAHRVLEGGDLHAEVGLGVHGVCSG